MVSIQIRAKVKSMAQGESTNEIFESLQNFGGTGAKDGANEQSDGEHRLNSKPRRPSAPHPLTLKRNR